MEAKRKEWEAENARLSRRVLFAVLGLVVAGMDGRILVLGLSSSSHHCPAGGFWGLPLSCPVKPLKPLVHPYSSTLTPRPGVYPLT